MIDVVTCMCRGLFSVNRDQHACFIFPTFRLFVFPEFNTVKPCFIAPDSSPNSHTAMKLSSPVFFPCKNPRYNMPNSHIAICPGDKRSNGQFTVDCPAI